MREEIPKDEKHPYCFAATRFWIADVEFKRKITSRPTQGSWLLSYREIARATDARTLIAAVILKCCTKNAFDPLRAASNQAAKASRAR